MIHFDAHADTGDIEFGSLWGHGQPMRRLIESGALRGDRFLQVGLRGYWPPPETLDWMAGQKMRSYEMTEIVHRGLDECLTEAFAIAMDDCDGVFLSVDIDVCDPGPRARHRHARARWAVRARAARRRTPDLPRAAGRRASTWSRSARRTTTPTSPRPWPTGSCSRRCRRSPASAGTSATAPRWDPSPPLLAGRGPGAGDTGRRPRLRRLVDAQAGKPEQPLHADPLRVELVAGRQDLEQVLDLERRAGLDQDVVVGASQTLQLRERRSRRRRVLEPRTEPARVAGDQLERTAPWLRRVRPGKQSSARSGVLMGAAWRAWRCADTRKFHHITAT